MPPRLGRNPLAYPGIPVDEAPYAGELWIDEHDVAQDTNNNSRVTSQGIGPVPPDQIWYIERVECRTSDLSQASWFLLVFINVPKVWLNPFVADNGELPFRDAFGPSSAGAFVQEKEIRMFPNSNLAVCATGLTAGASIGVHYQGYKVFK